jgi:hypothetical protein
MGSPDTSEDRSFVDNCLFLEHVIRDILFALDSVAF